MARHYGKNTLERISIESPTLVENSASLYQIMKIKILGTTNHVFPPIGGFIPLHFACGPRFFDGRAVWDFVVYHLFSSQHIDLRWLWLKKGTPLPASLGSFVVSLG